MDDRELMLMLAAILAIEPRRDKVGNWHTVALHDAMTLMDELECHNEMEKEKSCEWCHPK